MKKIVNIGTIILIGIGEKVKCFKCNYEWKSRKQEPKACPKCKNRLDKEIKYQKVSGEEKNCKFCDYYWMPSTTNPLACPRCKTRLDTPKINERKIKMDLRTLQSLRIFLIRIENSITDDSSVFSDLRETFIEVFGREPGQ